MSYTQGMNMVCDRDNIRGNKMYAGGIKRHCSHKSTNAGTHDFTMLKSKTRQVGRMGQHKEASAVFLQNPQAESNARPLGSTRRESPELQAAVCAEPQAPAKRVYTLDVIARETL